MKRKSKAIVEVKSEAGAIAQTPPDFCAAVKDGDLVNRFIEAQDIRGVSKEIYRRGVERFLAWLLPNAIHLPDRQSVLNFKTFLQESGLQPNTINLSLIGVRRFFAFLESLGPFPNGYPDIAKTVKGMKQPKTHRQVQTLSQAKETLSQIDTGTLSGKRDFAPILLPTQKRTQDDRGDSGKCRGLKTGRRRSDPLGPGQGQRLEG